MELNKYLMAGETTISNLILQNYQKIGMTNQELLVYIQLLMYQNKTYEFPNLEKISRNLKMPLDMLYQILDSLTQKKIIELKTHKSEDGKQSDYYCLLPIYEEIEKLETKFFTNNEDPVRELLQKIEQLIGRVLSNIEMEQAKNWIENDKYSQDLIMAAFKEAVINNVNAPFKYVNKILKNWKQKQITTVEEATREIYNHRMQSQSIVKNTIKVPINHSKE